LRVALLADTHLGPFDRNAWLERVVDVVTSSDPTSCVTSATWPTGV